MGRFPISQRSVSFRNGSGKTAHRPSQRRDSGSVAVRVVHGPLATGWVAKPPKPQPKLIELDKIKLETFFPAITKELLARGYQRNEVLIRAINRNRVDTMLRTGTDRDSTSMDWRWPKFDSMANPGRDPASITYAVPLELTQEAFLDLTHLDIGMQQHVRKGSAFAIYDAGALRRSPGALVEYEFATSPKDALLMVVQQSTESIQARKAALRRIGILG